MLDENSQWFCILVCNIFTAKHYRSRCRSRWENQGRGQYRFKQIKFVNLVVHSPCEREPYNNYFIIRSPSLSVWYLVTSWQPREAISRFSLENVIAITHKKNINCSKTRLDSTTNEQTIICRQLSVQVAWWALGQLKGRKTRTWRHHFLKSHQA